MREMTVMSHTGYLFVLRPTNGKECWVVGANVHPDDLAERLAPVPGFTRGYLIACASPVSDFVAAERDLVDLLSDCRANDKRPVFDCPERDAVAACRAVAGRFQPTAG